MNIRKLRSVMVEKGVSVNDLAKAAGMTKSTFYRRESSSGDSFTIKEANAIKSLLSLSANEAVEIFFTQEVA